MRPAVNRVHRACRASALKLRWVSAALIGSTVISMSLMLTMSANAQSPDRPALSPPVNQEVGRIEDVITAADDGYRLRSYVLTWRSMRIVVGGSPEESHVPGENLDIVVYRSEVNGHRALRFDANSPVSSEYVADHESANSSALITLGKAPVEDTISADSDGYRFVGYFVTWHDKRVFVVDPQSGPARSIGETINFRVLRTGLGANKRLSFSM